MIGRLNHVAIAVKDLAASTALYRDTLGAKVSAPLPQPAHGVTVVFVELPNTKIELLEPLDCARRRRRVDAQGLGEVSHAPTLAFDEKVERVDLTRIEGGVALSEQLVAQSVGNRAAT